jgi:hypothetical protein
MRCMENFLVTTKLVQDISRRAWKGLLAKAHPLLDPLLKDVCCIVNVEMTEFLRQESIVPLAAEDQKTVIKTLMTWTGNVVSRKLTHQRRWPSGSKQQSQGASYKSE